MLLQDAGGIGNLFAKSPLIDDGTILGLEYGRGYPSVLYEVSISIYMFYHITFDFLHTVPRPASHQD